MSDVTFKNTRFDPDLIEFHGIAQQMAKSVGYTADMSVEKQLAALSDKTGLSRAGWFRSLAG